MKQGKLTEVEGSVQLTSSLWQLVRSILFSTSKAAI